MNTKRSWLGSLRRLKISLSHSLATRWVSGRSVWPKPGTEKPLPSNIYHHINECPLCVFIDCVCDHDYGKLIKYGRASKENQASAWEIIYSQYSDTSGNPTSRLLISLSKDIAYHDAKLRSVGLCLKVLQHHPDPRCIAVLRGYGYDYPFDITRPEEYANSLEAVATRTGNIIITLQLKRAEYEREAGKVSGKPMTRESFYDILAVLFEHFHSRIDPKEVTVAEFVSYKKRYEMEMIALKKQTEKEKIHLAGMKNLAHG